MARKAARRPPSGPRFGASKPPPTFLQPKTPKTPARKKRRVQSRDRSASIFEVDDDDHLIVKPEDMRYLLQHGTLGRTKTRYNLRPPKGVKNPERNIESTPENVPASTTMAPFIKPVPIHTPAKIVQRSPKKHPSSHGIPSGSERPPSKQRTKCWSPYDLQIAGYLLFSQTLPVKRCSSRRSGVTHTLSPTKTKTVYSPKTPSPPQKHQSTVIANSSIVYSSSTFSEGSSLETSFSSESLFERNLALVLPLTTLKDQLYMSRQKAWDTNIWEDDLELIFVRDERTRKVYQVQPDQEVVVTKKDWERLVHNVG
ncbi:hypothetical protein EX30DRAFT_365262 [Ascodesmis nigricans]|uniref:Uncharacterized protein n=1 Tax=Ascodesmis nigricans TaxID=341454 RepID=A0A4S2MSU8_9PEZI|nr:hypothetical protein EX30DRAFT_365262 [Ascodesmis nigricans]